MLIKEGQWSCLKIRSLYMPFELFFFLQSRPTHPIPATTTRVLRTVLSVQLSHTLPVGVTSSRSMSSSSSLKILARFAVECTTPLPSEGSTTTLSVVVAQGSVVGFQVPPVERHRRDNNATRRRLGAIVNAANEGCLGGSGVDGAVTQAGGRILAKDRQALPVLCRATTTRCWTGHAVMTGPGKYGELKVPFVVHAVGPNYNNNNNNYHDDNDDVDTPDRLLRSAYQSSLEACRSHGVTDVAFSLLSAGVYRGRRSLKDVLTIGVKAIQDWWVDENHHPSSSSSSAANGGSSSLMTVTLCGYSEQEVALLMAICQENLRREEGVEG